MKVAIIGFGSVGQGVAESIQNKDLGIMITGIADSKSGVIAGSGIPVGEVLAKKQSQGVCGDTDVSAWDVVKSADYDVLVECTPTDITTGKPALEYIRYAINRGRHVVTSNKGPVALAYNTLMTEAGKQGVCLRYEATVCGAIPIIHTIQEGLAGNDILKIYGIFNGTCNYILTRMAEDGLTYEQALLEARELGYAEADPTYDVKGIDAAIKLVILANTVWGLDKSIDDVEITGIDNLTPEALQLAEKHGRTIRLIGEIDPAKGTLRVSPRIIPQEHPLVVDGTLNAVLLETDMADGITMIGRGAGSIETASAIIGDLIFIRDRYVKAA